MSVMARGILQRALLFGTHRRCAHPLFLCLRLLRALPGCPHLLTVFNRLSITFQPTHGCLQTQFQLPGCPLALRLGRAKSDSFPLPSPPPHHFHLLSALSSMAGPSARTGEPTLSTALELVPFWPLTHVPALIQATVVLPGWLASLSFFSLASTHTLTCLLPCLPQPVSRRPGLNSCSQDGL